MSTGYDWYILANQKYTGKTTVNGVDGVNTTVDFSDWQFIPNSNFDFVKSLLANNGEERCKVVFSHSAYESRKSWIKETQDKDNGYIYPCIYGLTQQDGIKVWYSSTNSNGHFGVKKVVVPCSKYTDAFIDNGKYGLCQFAFGIAFDTKEEGEGIKKALLSEKFQKIWQATEWIYNGKEWRMFKYFRKDFWKEFI